jgi:hypothetical protein
MTQIMQATATNTVKSSKVRHAPWLSLFLDGPAGGQFSTDISRTQNKSRRVVWIDKATKIIRIGPPLNDCDEYVTRSYRVIDVDARRHIIRWQLIPDQNDEPLPLMSAFRAGGRIRQ